MEVVVTSATIRRAKLHSYRHHHQTNTQLFASRMSFQQCHSTECPSNSVTALKLTSSSLTPLFNGSDVPLSKYRRTMVGLLLAHGSNFGRCQNALKLLDNKSRTAKNRKEARWNAGITVVVARERKRKELLSELESTEGKKTVSSDVKQMLSIMAHLIPVFFNSWSLDSKWHH